MTKEEISIKLIRIVANHLDIEESEITPEKTMKELGADSLDAVDTLMQIEQAFDIAITDLAMEKLNTIKDIIDYIEQHT